MTAKEAQTAIEILKELVERDTPKRVGNPRKVVHHDDITTWGYSDMYLCPKCNRVIAPFKTCDFEKSSYCDKCGQRLVWNK